MGPGHVPASNFAPRASSLCRLVLVPTQKSPGIAGAFELIELWKRSVFRDDGATPAIVHTSRNKIHVLTNGGGPEGSSRPNDGEVVVPAVSEDVVVFDGSGPIGCEAIFEADADDAAPVAV
jgi:hypothetical protein